MPFKNYGYSLIELIIALAAMTIVSVSVTAFITFSVTVQNRITTATAFDSVKREIVSTVTNRSAWKTTTSHASNTSLACIRTGTCTSASNGTLDLYASNGHLVFEGNNAALGMTTSGATCTTYSGSTPDPACPVKLNLTWTLRCETSSSCTSPRIVITGSLADPLNKIAAWNTVSHNFKVVRPARDPSPMNLEVPIEMLQVGAGSRSTLNQTYDLSMTSLNVGDYDGQVTYSFEIVAKNTDTVSRNVMLVNGTSTVVLTVPVANTVTVPTRIRVPWTPVGNDIYRLRLEQTTANRNLEVFTARILVKQQAATKTKIYIPMMSYHGIQTEIQSTAELENLDDTTYAQRNLHHYLFKKRSSSWRSLSGPTPWSIEVVLRTQGGNGHAALFNKTTNTQVAGTEITTTSGSSVLLTQSFADNATNFTDGDEFEFRLHDVTGHWVISEKNGIWVKLDNLEKADIYFALGRDNGCDTVNTKESRILMDTSLFTNPTFYHETDCFQDSGAGPASIMSHGTNDFGESGVSVVPGSLIPLCPSAKAISRVGPLTITSGNRFMHRTVQSVGCIWSHYGFMVVKVQN